MNDPSTNYRMYFRHWDEPVTIIEYENAECMTCGTKLLIGYHGNVERHGPFLELCPYCSWDRLVQ